MQNNIVAIIQSYESIAKLELALLLIATPLLLFPTVVPFLTILLLAVLFAVAIYTRITQHQPLLPSTPLTVPISLLLCMLPVALIVSADVQTSISKISSLLLGVLWWRFFSHPRSNAIQLCLLIFALYSFGLTTFALLTVKWPTKVLFLTPLLDIIKLQYLRLPDSPIAGVHANQFAGMLLMFIFVLIARLIYSKQTKIMVMLSILAVFLICLLFLTQSRSAWGGAVVGVVLLLLILAFYEQGSRKKIGQAGLFILFLVGISIVIIVGPNELNTIFSNPPQETAIGTFSTINFRFELWEWGLLAFSQFFFTGVGIGSFRHVAHRLYPVAVPESYDFAHAHNIFLQTGLDVGILGLLAYIAIILVALKMCVDLYFHKTQFAWLGLGVGLCVFALHTYGLTDAMALGEKPALLFWMALGLICQVYRPQPAKKI